MNTIKSVSITWEFSLSLQFSFSSLLRAATCQDDAIFYQKLPSPTLAMAWSILGSSSSCKSSYRELCSRATGGLFLDSFLVLPLQASFWRRRASTSASNFLGGNSGSVHHCTTAMHCTTAPAVYRWVQVVFKDVQVGSFWRDSECRRVNVYRCIYEHVYRCPGVYCTGAVPVGEGPVEVDLGWGNMAPEKERDIETEMKR